MTTHEKLHKALETLNQEITEANQEYQATGIGHYFLAATKMRTAKDRIQEALEILDDVDNHIDQAAKSEPDNQDDLEARRELHEMFNK